MRPSDVLDQQAALIDHLVTPAYEAYLTGYLATFAKTDPKSRSAQIWANEGTPLYIDMVRTSLKAANAYHVQAEMMPVLRAAAHDLEGTDYLVHDRLPSEHGFAVFDQPWHSKDVAGLALSYSAIQWGHTSFDGDVRGAPGVWVYFYTDANDDYDEINQQIRRGGNYHKIGRLQLSHSIFLAYEQRVGPAEIVTPEDYQALFEDVAVKPTSPNDARVIVALFRLLGQVLVEVRDAPIDRATSRRAKRMNLPARVQTIKLRRKEIRYLNDAPREHGPVEWQHSWIVRGHWAWRHCGAEHPLAEPYEKGYRARIYIAPYWKGPEDAPALITQKVFDLAQ